MNSPVTTPKLPDLESLVSRYGPVAYVREGVRFRGLDRFNQAGASVGGMAPGVWTTSPVVGGGRVLDDPDVARFIALAEGAERYSGGRFPDEEFVVASADELADRALDVSRIPACSPRELANPDCTMKAFDPSARIRWVEGTDLATGETKLVPGVMAAFGVPPESDGERFWFQISTGYAVHSSPHEAIVRGIYEVVERDMIAIAWLQMLPLPKLEFAHAVTELDYIRDWCARHFMRPIQFDATSDLGIPTVYTLLTSEYDTRGRHILGCATSHSLQDAAVSSLFESVTLRSLMHRDEPMGKHYKNYVLGDSARFMGTPDKVDAFSFLTSSPRSRIVDNEVSVVPRDPDQALAHMAKVFEKADMEVVVVDRTTAELAALGLTSVCVVIPALQPMSLQPLAQYLGHSRLYEAPAAMGYRSRREEDLNPWPQPFA